MIHLISTRLIRYDRAAATMRSGDAAAAATIGGGDVFHFICNFYILNIVI